MCHSFNQIDLIKKIDLFNADIQKFMKAKSEEKCINGRSYFHIRSDPYERRRYLRYRAEISYIIY